MKILKRHYLLMMVFIFWSPVLQAEGKSIDRSCDYERRIHDLSEVLKSSATSPDRVRASQKRVEYIKELDEVDRNTQFKFCADEDGKATLKFNTPEEKLRDRIAQLSSLINWFATQAAKLGTAAVSTAIKQAQADLKRLSEIQKNINKIKDKGLTEKDEFEQLLAEYRRLRDDRRTSMDNLSHMADRVLCLGMSTEDMDLARLYHETIPQDGSCNDLVKNALLDRIKRSPTLGFGALLQPDTYQKAKTMCRNLTTLAKPAHPGGDMGEGFLGCFAENRKDIDPRGLKGRVLNQAIIKDDPKMTIGKCISFCRGKGVAYAGLQYSKWCFCGNDHGGRKANNCNMNCSGDKTQKCGGAWANSVYEIKSGGTTNDNGIETCEWRPGGTMFPSVCLCKKGQGSSYEAPHSRCGH